MPEATMHENRHAMSRQHYVWAPRKPLIMDPEPEAGRMQVAANTEFGQGVFRAYARHHAGAGRRVDYIHQPAHPSTGPRKFQT